MQEFQLGEKPSARSPIDLAENEQEQGCNVRVEEEDNNWPYAKPAVYVVRGLQTEEALNLNRKPYHRGKRGSGKSKKRQVTPADSNINEASELSTIGKETVEGKISQVETQCAIPAPASVSNTRKYTVAYDVSNIETAAGIQKEKRNRHEPKPPAVFVDYFLNRWIESLGSATPSPAIITRANKSAGDNEREWEESFSNVIASLKRTSVSKIKALFNEKGDTSGEGESLSKVVNSNKQSASVKKILSIFSPRPVAVSGTGRRRMSVFSPTVSSKVNSDYSQHLQFRAIATCRPSSSTVFSKADGEHLQNLQSPTGVTFQLLRIAPGNDEAFLATFDGTRICSVAKGRVKVTYCRKKLNIGEGEVWGVRRGELFILHNPSNEEAVVHVVTIWDVPKFESEGPLPGTFEGFP
jgi:hypothetical protein